MWFNLAVIELVIGAIICLVLENREQKKEGSKFSGYWKIFFTFGVFFMIVGFVLMIFALNTIEWVALGFTIYGVGIAFVSLGAADRSEKKVIQKLTEIEDKISLSLIGFEKNQEPNNK